MRPRWIAAVTAVLLSLALPAASGHGGGGPGGPAEQAGHHGHTGQLDRLRDLTAPYAAGPAAPWTIQVVDLAGITCIEDPRGTGAMGIHFVDGANLMDGAIDGAAPEALIYEPQPDGSLTLVGAEHLVLAESWDADHQQVPMLHGQKFSLVEAGNRYGLPAFYELHVWHERANPNGLFDDWNPTVSCPLS
ncbi:hypothetical protein [Ornithinimicrobium cavernae]|uniref:hypothetical protein n=1 Tax=Ornithinimicrobium cavernae TaxID=2666047 RepID=UPI000D696B2D|nr:hypothetical protein [Ornithinimicrobium cavernae]